MASRPQLFRPSRSKRERDLDVDERRGTAHSRGYDAAWRKARARFLSAHPLCEYCDAGAWGDPPRTTLADLVDHLYPHGGDRRLFWVEALWVACCKACHDGPKQRLEHAGLAALDGLARKLSRPLKCEVMT